MFKHLKNHLYFFFLGIMELANIALLSCSLTQVFARGTETGERKLARIRSVSGISPTPRRSSTRGWTRHKTDPQPTAVTCTKDSFNPILPAQGPQPYFEKELHVYELVEILMFLFCRLLKVMMVPWWWLCDTANYGRCLKN